MSDWKPGDECQVRRGRKWVDAEVLIAEGREVRVSFSDYARLLWVTADDLRPRPAPRGRLPEPSPMDKALREHALKALDGKAALKPVPKPQTARDNDYLAHVRRHPCCSCGTEEGVQAHHLLVGGWGMKGSDYLAAPLCWKCHDHLESTGHLPSTPFNTYASGRIGGQAIVWEAAARCLAEWVEMEGER